MSFLAMIGNIGLPEIIVILMIGLLLFGSRLPEVGRSLGRGLMEFKKGLRGMQDQLHDIDHEADRRIDEEIQRRGQANPAPMPPPLIDVPVTPTVKLEEPKAGTPAESPASGASSTTP